MLDRVNLQHLRCFIAVAEELHFSRAAQSLALTEQEMGDQLHVLEDLLGVPLLVRSSHQLELTPAGEMLLEGSRDLLKDTLKLLGQVQDLGSSLGETVRIGFAAGEVHSLVEPVFGEVLTRHPGINLSRVELPGDQLKQALASREIDLAVGLEHELQDQNIEFQALAEGSHVLVMPEAHAFSSQDMVAPEQLRAQPILLVSETGAAGNQTIRDHFAAHGVVLDVVYQPAQMDTAKALVEQGTGLWLVPSFAVNQLPPGLVCRAIRGFEKPIAGMAWRKGEDQQVLKTVLGAFQARHPDPFA